MWPWQSKHFPKWKNVVFILHKQDTLNLTFFTSYIISPLEMFLQRELSVAYIAAYTILAGRLASIPISNTIASVFVHIS